mgnify:CR=1 FL=1
MVYTLATPVHDTIRQYVIASGKVEPRDEVLIKPQISGIISEVLCKAGDRVNRRRHRYGEGHSRNGNPQCRRIPRDGSPALARPDPQGVRTHRSPLCQSVVSQEEFEKGQTTLRQAEEEFQNAEDNLEIVKTGITNRYKDLSNTQIRSTITGMILDVPIKVGNSVIQANTFTTAPR